jgi:crotonobetainyl-CoA:carnitine CoA-transferase CaiB-like acyl-CoA transferase
VETTLVQGILAHDCWNWLIRTIVSRYPGAFAGAAPSDPDALVPNSPLFFRLMAGLSSDGRWMQFSQTTDRLWNAYLRAAGLEWTKDDPILQNGTTDEDPEVRVAFWEAAIKAVRDKTYAEWTKAFDEEPDVWAEIFRYGTELLHHPQIVHNRSTVVIEDPEVGPVLQPGALVQMSKTPADLTRPAPTLDQHAQAIRSEHDAGPGSTKVADEPAPSAEKPAPLAGVTVIELGTFYAAPFGATILADLGARVIKVEQLDGDPIRHIMPFPEVGGAKVLAGKESVAVDMASQEGRRIVLELVRRADVVLQTFRAGVAERHGYTANDLLAVNPDLVYLNAPGYGIDGPCGHRPAFAPTMGAGSGLAYRNVGGPDNVPSSPDQTLLDVKRNSIRLSAAAMSVGHADGFAALGVASALLVGLLAKKRGAPGQSMMTSMLSTMAHTLSEDMVEYENRPPFVLPNADLLGLSATYRLYEAADGWVFLAAPSEKESRALVRALDLDETLDDAALATTLEGLFATKPAEEWERELDAHDVTCAAVAPGPIEEVVMLGGGMGREMGIVTDTTHPVLGDYSRLTPLVRYERLGGVAGPAPLCGQQTDAVLVELGYDQEQIDRLRAEGVLG